MTEEKQPKDSLSDEFRNLGHNLMNALRAAWDNPEREKLQQEIETGLNEFTSTVKEEIDHFSQSPSGQRLRSDVEDLQERVRSGEVETKVRNELLNTLRTVNTELEKVAGKLQPDDAEEPEEENSSSSEEV